MKYETAEAFRTALEQRLKDEAEASGTALVRLRKRVAFERFLARLAASESGGWVLKGAFALELRLGLRTRMTKDIDLGRADDEEAATKHLNAATGVDLGDFFSFEARRTPALDAATGFRAVRYTVRADLDGRRFEQRPRRHGQDRTRSWHAKSESRSRSRPATQRPLGYSTLCFGRKLEGVGTPKRGAGANVRS